MDRALDASAADGRKFLLRSNSWLLQQGQQSLEGRSNSATTRSPSWTQRAANLQSAASTTSSSAFAEDEEDEHLFEAPPDLVCPITHQLFFDPVINSAGQIYDRAAIERHMQTRLTDPLTGSPLASGTLTAVYAVRSRAAEYREHVARVCIARACSRTCQEPVCLLHRAADMVASAHAPMPLRIPGLAPSLVSFLTSHTSNAYDSLALQLFADGLCAAGYSEQAAGVYCQLLSQAPDHKAAAAALRHCLGCWMNGTGYDPAGLPGAGGPTGRAATPPQELGTIARLAHFVEVQQVFSAAQLIDLMVEAGQPRQLLVQLLEHLSLQHEGGAACNNVTGGSSKYLGLSLKYTQLCQALVEDQLQQFRDMLAQQAVHRSGSTASLKAAEAAAGVATLDIGGCKSAASGRRQQLANLWRFCCRLCEPEHLVSCAFVALTMVGSRHVAARAGQAASALYLMHRSGRERV